MPKLDIGIRTEMRLRGYALLRIGYVNFGIWLLIKILKKLKEREAKTAPAHILASKLYMVVVVLFGSVRVDLEILSHKITGASPKACALAPDVLPDSSPTCAGRPSAPPRLLEDYRYRRAVMARPALTYLVPLRLKLKARSTVCPKRHRLFEALRKR